MDEKQIVETDVEVTNVETEVFDVDYIEEQKSNNNFLPKLIITGVASIAAAGGFFIGNAIKKGVTSFKEYKEIKKDPVAYYESKASRLASEAKEALDTADNIRKALNKSNETVVTETVETAAEVVETAEK